MVDHPATGLDRSQGQTRVLSVGSATTPSDSRVNGQESQLLRQRQGAIEGDAPRNRRTRPRRRSRALGREPSPPAAPFRPGQIASTQSTWPRPADSTVGHVFRDAGPRQEHSTTDPNRGTPKGPGQDRRQVPWAATPVRGRRVPERPASIRSTGETGVLCDELDGYSPLARRSAPQLSPSPPPRPVALLQRHRTHDPRCPRPDGVLVGDQADALGGVGLVQVDPRDVAGGAALVTLVQVVGTAEVQVDVLVGLGLERLLRVSRAGSSGGSEQTSEPPQPRPRTTSSAACRSTCPPARCATSPITRSPPTRRTSPSSSTQHAISYGSRTSSTSPSSTATPTRDTHSSKKITMRRTSTSPAASPRPAARAGRYVTWRVGCFCPVAACSPPTSQPEPCSRKRPRQGQPANSLLRARWRGRALRSSGHMKGPLSFIKGRPDHYRAPGCRCGGLRNGPGLADDGIEVGPPVSGG